MRYIFDEETKSTTQSVSEFLTAVNTSLLRHRGRIEGEVTSIKNTYATAVYFSIKDTESDALLNCVIWRTTYQQNGVEIKEGDKVIVTGVPEIYPARGSFSLKVQTIEYAGEGALKKAYDELKLRLTTAGLLAAERKRAVPQYPKKIGVITSRSGVVIQDFSANLGRYGFQITMVDSRVEGKDAIHELLAALCTMATQDLEVLVIMRGGGSWESLQAFNTESVVRAIAQFPCPVVTGIGHDVDVTLVELVADVGSSTPTAVAEVLNESWDTLVHAYDVAETGVFHAYRQVLGRAERTTEQQQALLLRRFEMQFATVRAQYVRSSTTIQSVYRRLANRAEEMKRIMETVLTTMRTRLGTIRSEVTRSQGRVLRGIGDSLSRVREDLYHRSGYLLRAERRGITTSEATILHLEQQLKAHDPNRPLQLGYSLSYVDGTLIRQASDVVVGKVVVTAVKDGSFTSTVNKVV